jgi:hypothetical protein
LASPCPFTLEGAVVAFIVLLPLVIAELLSLAIGVVIDMIVVTAPTALVLCPKTRAVPDGSRLSTVPEIVTAPPGVRVVPGAMTKPDAELAV